MGKETIIVRRME